MPNFDPITNPMTLLITRRNLLYSAPRLEGDGKERKRPMSEFNEFEPCQNSAKNRFQLSAGLNLEIMNTTLNGTNHI